MEFDCEETNDLLIVTALAERIDAAAALKFKDGVRDLVGKAKASHVVLDLSKVEFIDSSGLGAVVAVKKLLGASKRLDLAGLTPTVDKVFRLTRMDSIFTIYAQAGDAGALYKAG